VDEHERSILIRQVQLFYAGFFKCPTTGQILEQLPGDDKVLCGCRVSNPKAPTERTEHTGTHIVRFLDAVTAEEYVDARARARVARTGEA